MSIYDASALIASITICIAGSEGLPAQTPDLEVHATTSSPEYVVGEPVLAQVALKNTSEHTMTIWELLVHDDGVGVQMEMYLSNDGQSFERIRTNSPPGTLEPSHYLIVRSGETIRFRLRILYRTLPSATRRPNAGPAFPVPGRYWLKFKLSPYMRTWDNPQDAPWNNGKVPKDTMRMTVRDLHRLATGDHKHKHQDLSVGPIEILVKEPTGIDKKVWEQINSPDYYYFMQLRYLPRKDKEVALNIARILTEVPTSSYHPGMRYALSHMRPQGGVRWEREEKELIHQALNTERGYLSIGPHAPLKLADDRLETVIVKLNYPRRTQLAKVLEEVSKESGVKLRLAASLERHLEFQITGAEITLGEFMQSVTSPGRTYWIPDGDGYVLTPVELNKSNQSQPAPNDATDNDTESPDLRTDANDEDR